MLKCLQNLDAIIFKSLAMSANASTFVRDLTNLVEMGKSESGENVDAQVRSSSPQKSPLARRLGVVEEPPLLLLAPLLVV